MSLIAIKEISEMAVSRFADCPLGKLTQGKSFDKPMSKYDKPLLDRFEDWKYCPIEGNGGHWEGERGDSKWIPDREFIPRKANPEGKNWGEIMDKYGIDGIEFKGGQPDFSEISKGTVEIKSFSDSRTDNFDKADIELAKQKGVSPGEISKYRKEEGYTWHECADMKTMQLVPKDIHNNISHSGGISEIKKGLGEQHE